MAADSSAEPGSRVRVAIVTNIPAPYRVPVYNQLARIDGIDLTVFYAAPVEPDRQWDLPPLTHVHAFLGGSMYTRNGRFIHYSPRLWDELVQLRPDVVVTTGYNPTHLLGFLYALLYRSAHVAMTDGTVESEARLGWAHRFVRRLVIACSAAGVAASHGGWRLFRQYGMPAEWLHFAPLAENGSVNWAIPPATSRDIDLLFSGRLVPVKNPGFALQVAAGVAQRLGRRVSLTLLGTGPLEEELQARAKTLEGLVDVVFAGHRQQAEMPLWFGRARLFLFPTRWDPWGVVANEACRAGTPVLVSQYAGVAGELVRDGSSGRVLPLELGAWVDAAAALLSQPEKLARLSAGAARAGLPYSSDNAAAGLADAVMQAATGSANEQRSRFTRRPRVVCIQRRLPHYRVPLFEALREELDRRDIEFVLVHGQPSQAETSKQDSGVLPWAVHSPCHYWLGNRLVWQDPRPAVIGADLVIVTQENRLLYNLLTMTAWRPSRLAYWGHGRNFQAARPRSLTEAFKRQLTRHVDWWFAYTDISAEVVRRTGFAPECVTTIDNAVDTSALAADIAGISPRELADFRTKLGLGDGPVGLFMGSLYADKLIPFLLAAALELHRRLPDFQLLVVGAGPLTALVQAAAEVSPWIHALGMRTGKDKALCLRAADLLLNPGLVGLGILDGFVAGLPMVTTDCKLHSPEIAYLRPGKNGVMTPAREADFVQACEQLLRDPDARAVLSAGALADSHRYTIDEMCRRFADGIEAALRVPARR